MEREQIIEGLEWKRRIATQIGTVAFVEGEIGALCDLIHELTEENERLRAKGKEQIIGETADISRQLIETSITRALVAKEIFAEIDGELSKTFECNLSALQKRLDNERKFDTLAFVLGSKINLLQDIFEILYELKKKYGVTDNGEIS